MSVGMSSRSSMTKSCATLSAFRPGSFLIRTLSTQDLSGATAGGTLNTPGGSTTIGMTLSDIPAECAQYPGWSEDNSAEIQKGWILKADTIDELIKKMAEVDEVPDAEVVKATIEKYNGYCAAGSASRFPAYGNYACAGFDPAVLRVPPLSRRLLDARRPEEGRQRAGARPDDKPIGRLYAAGCFGTWRATPTAFPVATTPRIWFGAASPLVRHRRTSLGMKK